MAEFVPCQDCGVQVGQPHGDGCDVARCLATGLQRISCGGNHPDMGVVGPPYQPGVAVCGRHVWTGTWPGEAECVEFGWWSYFTPETGWVRCSGLDDHPEAGPDLNRLYSGEAWWDRDAGRWRLRQGAKAGIGGGA